VGMKDLINVLPAEYMLKIIDFKPDLVNWVKLSYAIKLPESFIEKYKDRVNWHYISNSQKLSEEFIEKYKDRVDWNAISEYQKLSESFIEKYNDDVNWYNILAYQKHLSDEFKEKHMWKVSPLLRKYLTENNSLEELN